MTRAIDPPKRPIWRQRRWQLALVGFVLGVFETAVALLAGLEIRLGDRDATLWVGGFVELSFAVWGYLLGSTLEIRERERLASSRLRSQAERLTQIRARLAESEKLAVLGQLAGTIAHEVRNPLAILRSMTQNLSESVDDEEVDRTCEALIEEMDRLSRVTSSLLDLAKPLSLERSPVGVEEILERTDLLAQQMLAARSIKLTRSGSGSKPVVLEADPDLICQVLLELLSNAAAVSPEGSEVRLESAVLGDLEPSRLELTVVDSGPGVPATERPRIFEPFYTTRSDGHGLGLAVARQIAEAHGGSLGVTPVATGGARFHLRLPMRSEAAG